MELVSDDSAATAAATGGGVAANETILQLHEEQKEVRGGQVAQAFHTVGVPANKVARRDIRAAGLQ